MMTRFFVPVGVARSRITHVFVLLLGLLTLFNITCPLWLKYWHSNTNQSYIHAQKESTRPLYKSNDKIGLLPSIPQLIPGKYNLPEVLYASIVIMSRLYGNGATIDPRTLNISACHPQPVCQAFTILRKYFKAKFHIGHQLYHLKLLKQRRFAATKRPDRCSGCFKYSFTTLIAPKSVCSGSGPVDLLVLITSTLHAVAERKAVRYTLAPFVSNNTGNVRYVFLIGWTGDNVTDLKYESATFGDILMDDYKDSYYNLSYKVLSGFKWALQNCPRAKFIARSADDVYLNVPHIINLLRENRTELQRKQIGRCPKTAVVTRGSYTRHYQTYNDWPQKRYGPYCVGTTFIISASGLVDIVKESPNVPWFNLEDHWVGQVAERVGLRIQNVAGFNTQYYPDPNVKRYIEWRRKKGVCNFDPKWYTLHRVLPSDMMLIYQHCLHQNG